jgi:hypothetical protein
MSQQEFGYAIGDLVRCVSVPHSDCGIKIGEVYQIGRTALGGRSGTAIQLRGIPGWFDWKRFHKLTREEIKAEHGAIQRWVDRNTTGEKNAQRN